MKRLLLLPIAVVFFAVGAQTPPPAAAKSDRDAALARIKKWRNFDGTWEGEVRYVAAPKEDWCKLRMPFKVVFKGNEPKVFFRQGVRDWQEMGATYRTHHKEELTIVIRAYGAGGVWTENNVVILTRRTEDTGDVFIQRVVNNWSGQALPGEDLVYGDTRAGKVKHQ